jgi:hypothetical protein
MARIEKSSSVRHLPSIISSHGNLWLAFSLLASLTVPLARAQQPLQTPGLTQELNGNLDEVRAAVRAVVADQIIHGTKVFDKEPTLTGAQAVDSTPLFPPSSNSDEVYYKIRKDAIAPRNFVESADQGTIGVRFIVIPDGDRTRVHVDAIYVEGSRRKIHASDGTVEKSELKEIKDQLEANQEAAQEAADARRRTKSAELVRQSFTRQREDESTRLSNARTAEQQLDEQVRGLHHELERRIKAPGADLKAAPFQSAATLKTLAAFSEVVIIIVTPHWLGVETPEGQRGWLPEEHLEQLP